MIAGICFNAIFWQVIRTRLFCINTTNASSSSLIKSWKLFDAIPSLQIWTCWNLQEEAWNLKLLLEMSKFSMFSSNIFIFIKLRSYLSLHNFDLTINLIRVPRLFIVFNDLSCVSSAFSILSRRTGNSFLNKKFSSYLILP